MTPDEFADYCNYYLEDTSKHSDCWSYYNNILSKPPPSYIDIMCGVILFGIFFGIFVHYLVLIEFQL